MAVFAPTRVHIFPAISFDAWHDTPGGVFSRYPGTLAPAFVPKERRKARF